MPRRIWIVALLTCSPLLIAADTAKGPIWEYAQLMNSRAMLVWTTGSQQIGEVDADPKKSVDSVYRKLGGKEPSAKVTLVNLLNLVGGKGWELTSVDREGEVATFIFKRPIN